MNKMRKLGLVVATAAAFSASTASAEETPSTAELYKMLKEQQNTLKEQQSVISELRAELNSKDIQPQLLATVEHSENGATTISAHKDWSGFYGGAVVGATAFKTDTADYWCWYACDAPGDSEVRANGGLTAGYNWQLSKNFVVGIEADISSGAKSSETIMWHSDHGVNWKSEWDWLATVRARVGLAVDRTLVYVTGGVAIADAEYNAQQIYYDYTNTDRASWDGKLTGLVAGAGVEHALTENMSFKAEYLYVSMPKKDACWGNDSGCYDGEGQNDERVHWITSAHLARLGLNWKF